MSMLKQLVKSSVEITLAGPDGGDIIHPETGAKMNVVLKVQGTAVPTIKQKAIEANAYLMSAGKTDDAKKMAKAVLDAEAAATAIAGEAVIGWNEDGDVLFGQSYTPAFAKELLASPEAEFIRKQVNEAVGDQQKWFRSGQKRAE